MTQNKIDIISHSYPSDYQPYNGLFVRDHASAISSQFDTKVFVPTPYAVPFTLRQRKNCSNLISPENIKALRVRYFSLPSKTLPYLIRYSLSKNLLSSVRKSNADLIHVHFMYSSGLAIPALKKLDQPLVLTLHGVDFYHTVNDPRLKKLIHTSLLAADAIIAVGPQLYNDICSHFPELESKLCTIYNFVDTSYFKPSKTGEKTIIKQELALKSDRFQLLCVANFRYKKGIDVLNEALLIANELAEFDLHLIGRRNEEPNFEADVLSSIKKKGIQNFHIHGPQPRSSILKWMQAVDGFVLPSRNEPFGISLIEAMASGLPVISTKSGGPEAILSGDYGSLIEKENPKALADAIIQMVKHKPVNLLAQRKYIQENFGKDRYTNAHTRLYKKLLS